MTLAFINLPPKDQQNLSGFVSRLSSRDWEELQRKHRESALARREPARKYFLPHPVTPGGPTRHLAVAGLALFVLYFSFQVVAKLAGGGGLALGPLILMTAAIFFTRAFIARYVKDWMTYRSRLRARAGRATDEQMDAWLRQDLTNLQLSTLADFKNGAISFRESAPRVAFGPASSNNVQAQGEDGVWRFAKYSILIVCMGDRQFSAYSCDWDMTTTQPVGPEISSISKYAHISQVNLIWETVPILTTESPSKGAKRPEVKVELYSYGLLELSIGGARRPIQIPVTSERNGTRHNVKGGGSIEMHRAFKHKTDT